MRIKRIGDHKLPIPSRATPGSCAYDLSAAEDFLVYPGSPPVKVPTGFAWEIDIGTAIGSLDLGIPTTEYGLIRDLPSLVAHGVFVVGGVVHGDCRGEVHVKLMSNSAEPYRGKAGDRIAQMIIGVAAVYPLGEIGPDEDLSETQRGTGGFGSDRK